MESMAELMRKLGWIAWCLTIIGWFLSPIISLLVNKIFVCLVFDTSKKLKELKNDIIRKLEKMLCAVEEQTVLRADEDKGSRRDLKILDSMKKDLKSALYEAEDILDLLDYRRIEKELHLGDDDSCWVENQLGAVCAWIACCKGSSFGRWIHVTHTLVMKSAQSMIRQGQLVIQGWRHFDLYSICRAINIIGAAVLQCAQSWYQQLGQLFRSAILPRSGVLLLPVSMNPAGQGLQSRGSEFVPADPAHRPAEEMVDEEGEAEERQNGEEGEKSEEIEEEGSEGGQEGEVSEQEIEEESNQVEEVRDEEEIEEDDKEGKEGEPTSSSILRYCARSMLTWFAKACFYRDWSYGIKSDKKDVSEIESLVPITERISLKNRIKCIEDILNTSEKSDLLNDTNSSSSTPNDGDKESSSSCTVKNSAEESTSTQKEIDDVYRRIEKEVFGRDKDRKHICRMLREGSHTSAVSCRSSKPYSVIGIYGITGSGKTTLAQYVCEYEKSAEHFNLIMFVLVGKSFSVLNIFREMLDQIKQQWRATELKDLKSVKEELEKELKGKRFLLVLDDLWVNGNNMKECRILLDVFRVGQSGSRILVTAQKKNAAAALDVQEKMQIPIPDLEEEQCLTMFMHYALDGSQVSSTDNERYKEIGRKITKKLRRSPIAAITVAARLKSNSSFDFWERTSNLDVLDETMGAVWWSYEQLGVDIRRCFAYCSIFPRGYRLKRDKLVRIWIAQGFVKDETEDLEDRGHHYFDELLTFSFLQVQRKISFGEEIVGFTIHDLLHELAERVSGSEFFRIGLDDSPEDIPRGVHHLFIENTNGIEIAEKLVAVENLRTLIIKEPTLVELMFTNGGNRDTKRLLERLFTRMTKLRVLIIKQNDFGEELSVPACIDKMKHLHYLGLRFRGELSVLILPSTFSKLYHIEIIDIPFNRASRYPEDLANLIYSRHIPDLLYFPNIGRLTSLQTLTDFRVQEEEGYGLDQLKHLNKLRGILNIKGLEIVGSKEEALHAHLTHKERLRGLKLWFNRDKRFGPDVEAEVLEGLCPPKQIKLLHIENYGGSRYPSWMLSRQHPDAPKNLYRLELHCSSQLASIPEVLIGLRQLGIHGCGWDRLPENMECLVSLQTLEIWHCNEIVLLPTLPHQCLNNIIINRCSVLSATCKVEGHDNWHKINHIRRRNIH